MPADAPVITEDRSSPSRGLDNATDGQVSTVNDWARAAQIRSELDTVEAVGWLKQVEATTRLALQQFHLQATLLESILTPNAALL